MRAEHGIYDIAFVSVAFGDQRYLDQQVRLKASIYGIYTDPVIFFWRHKLPTGSRSMSDSLYGFKPHAVNYARQAGYTKICFFDPAVVLVKPVDHYLEMVKDYGVIAVQDDNKLSPFCGDRALSYYGLTRKDISTWHLVGGSFYFFDFDLPLCQNIFHEWIETEKLGLFGSQKEQASGQLQGHRNDEAMMALALYTCGSRPVDDDHRYNCENDEIAILKKYHFK